MCDRCYDFINSGINPVLVEMMQASMNSVPMGMNPVLVVSVGCTLASDAAWHGSCTVGAFLLQPLPQVSPGLFRFALSLSTRGPNDGTVTPINALFALTYSGKLHEHAPRPTQHDLQVEYFVCSHTVDTQFRLSTDHVVPLDHIFGVADTSGNAFCMPLNYCVRQKDRSTVFTIAAASEEAWPAALQTAIAYIESNFSLVPAYGAVPLRHGIKQRPQLWMQKLP